MFWIIFPTKHKALLTSALGGTSSGYKKMTKRSITTERSIRFPPHTLGIPLTNSKFSGVNSADAIKRRNINPETATSSWDGKTSFTSFLRFANTFLMTLEQVDCQIIIIIIIEHDT